MTTMATSGKPQALRIHRSDNVAVALTDIGAGEEIRLDEQVLVAADNIPAGHKLALAAVSPGERVIKYGAPIGVARMQIKAGEWVHEHNLSSALKNCEEYACALAHPPAAEAIDAEFMAYVRPNGEVGTRNEVWILPLVGCINALATELAGRGQRFIRDGLEGVYAFTHPYGCSQLGDDLAATRRVLASLARHPNAGAVLIMGLGCENNTMEDFRRELGDWDPRRVAFLLCQQEEDELAAGEVLLEQLADYAAQFRRQPAHISKLKVGFKCGGSDSLSGVTANPLLGRFCDRLTASGGTALLSEVPEMFGAESALLPRCANEEVFGKACRMINGFKGYFLAHGQGVGENPSPGNRKGGITTLEEKSLGNVQKGGSSLVTDVLDYAERSVLPGLNLIYGPGNDQVSCTALAAAGAQLILFTTGRGTPFGSVVPTIKISTNTNLFKKKRGWIDLDAGTLLDGRMEEGDEELLRLILSVAGGQQTCAERLGAREIAIFKNGVTL